MPRYTGDEFSRFVGWLRKRRIDVVQDMAQGAAQDYAGYKDLVGYVRALDDIETELNRLTGNAAPDDRGYTNQGEEYDVRGNQGYRSRS